MAYSCDIFTEEFPSGFLITPGFGAQLVAISNLIGSIFSIPLIHRVGRRTIILIGQGSITVCLFLLVIVASVDAPALLLILLCAISFMFQMTIGPLAPLYAAEVCNDVALGAVMVCEDLFTLV